MSKSGEPRCEGRPKKLPDSRFAECSTMQARHSCSSSAHASWKKRPRIFDSKAVRCPTTRRMAHKRFGKYEVLARLATGGAANIFLARQPGAADFHKLVCLKTLLPERASDADFVAMFLDEARPAARI